MKRLFQVSGKKTTPDVLGQKVCYSGGMSVLMSYLWGIPKGDGLQGRGEAPGAVVETSGSG